MRRFFKTISILLMVILLTGCVEQKIHMDITNDEMQLKVITAMDSSLTSEDDLQESIDEAKAQGYDAKLYKNTEDNMIGIEVSKSYKLKDIRTSDDVEFHLETIMETADLPKVFKYEDGVYTANFVYDATETSMGGYSSDELASYSSYLKFTYSVTLPSKAKSHNADEVDGHTYTWNIKFGEVNEINYSFGASSPLVYIVIGVCAAIVIAIIVVLILKKKKNGNTPIVDNSVVNTTMNAVPVQPMINPTVETPVEVVPPMPVVAPVESVTVPTETQPVVESPMEEQPDHNQNVQ